MAKDVYKTVLDFIKIIELFTDLKAEELAGGEIASALGMDSSKVSRMMGMLVREGVFERSEQTGKYRLGLIFFELGLAFIYHFPLRKIIRPHLEQIAREKRAAVSWSILRGDKVITIDRIDHLSIDLITHRIGLNIPIHSTSAGKILLANQPKEEQQRILNSVDLLKYTRNTVTDVEAISFELERTFERGYSSDAGESQEGLNCLGAPIYDEHGNVVAALNLMVNDSQVDSEEFFTDWPEYLKDRAMFISRQLGYLYSAA